MTAGNRSAGAAKVTEPAVEHQAELARKPALRQGSGSRSPEPLSVKIFFLIYKCYRFVRDSRLLAGHAAAIGALRAFRMLLCGFFLGAFKRETVHWIDEIYYLAGDEYFDENYNRSGLFEWEADALDAYFSHCRSLLVAGAGGGREILALRNRGYDVAGFECNLRLVQFAHQFLGKEGLAPDIEHSPRDQCPFYGESFDGLIVGWGAYMLIQGSEHRVAFLRQLRARGRRGSPILLSFFCRATDGAGFPFAPVVAAANGMSRICGRDRRQLGDMLELNYTHYFTRDEVASELRAGGFDLTLYSTAEYGHAVGVAT